MSIPPTSPGVHVTEVPGGSRPVTGVDTSITCVVGTALRGLVDEPVPISSFSGFERTFGGLGPSSGLGYAVRDFFLNGGRSALVVRVAHDDATTARLTVGDLRLEALGPGAWANTLVVEVEHPDPGDDLFTLTIRGGAGDDAVEEVYRDVTTVDGPQRVDRVLESSALVRADAPVGSRPPAGTTTVAVAGQGADGGPVDADDYAGAGFDSEERGLYALQKADLVNLICLPPPTPGGELPASLWATAAAYAVSRRAFLIVDPPPELDARVAADWPAAHGLSGEVAMRNAALYYPRITVPQGTLAACGAVAGVMARTDETRGVWKAPAGIDARLAGVTDLSVQLTDDESGALNRVGINSLRSFPEVGPVVWGARTLRGSDALFDEWKYVPVRRLALFLEESLDRSTRWAVFEPNDEPLWAQLRLAVGAFLHDLFRMGAFQGSTPREAFFVKCDAETTTQDDIDRGVVSMLVGFAPLKPAEFVVLSIRQKTAAATV